jgi:hypothetical protein
MQVMAFGTYHSNIFLCGALTASRLGYGHLEMAWRSIQANLKGKVTAPGQFRALDTFLWMFRCGADA